MSYWTVYICTLRNRLPSYIFVSPLDEDLTMFSTRRSLWCFIHTCLVAVEFHNVFIPKSACSFQFTFSGFAFFSLNYLYSWPFFLLNTFIEIHIYSCWDLKLQTTWNDWRNAFISIYNCFISWLLLYQVMMYSMFDLLGVIHRYCIRICNGGGEQFYMSSYMIYSFRFLSICLSHCRCLRHGLYKVITVWLIVSGWAVLVDGSKM